MPSILEQYRIADFLEWYNEKKLVLNPEFQRGSVWTPPARTFLIDSILRELPIPKIYLRTRIDIEKKTSIREVVDGQQRLRTIIDFSNDKFSLTKRAGEFSGLRFSTMSGELQELFLSYPIAVHQLLNASDDDVLEVFSRLNSYSVQLNAAEKRHAKYQGEFKWTVRRASRNWNVLWDEYKIVTVRNRVRMLDDSLIAEMFGILLDGVTDGGQPKIDAIYKQHDAEFEKDDVSVDKLDDTLSFFVEELADYLEGTIFLSAPHFLMLFAALAHARHGIPMGSIGDSFPECTNELSDLEVARENLLQLAALAESDEEPEQYADFWKASKATTHRISSRRERFKTCFRALAPRPI